MAKKATESSEVYIAKVDRETADFCILGTAPLICNRMSQKARQELLLPKGKKTAAEKAASLKHDPMQEFRASPYLDMNEDGPTRIQVLSSMFKKACMTAALDIPGARKAQIGRLLYVVGDRVSVYGVPELMMSVTRSADMNKTPDVRTRAILRHWAARITVSFVAPIIKLNSVANLLAAGGITAGIGDWRVEKGSGSYGTFEIVADDDPRYLDVVNRGGADVQRAALESPEPYDDETSELLSWYAGEVARRGFKAA
jgi:hypothetical protein